MGCICRSGFAGVDCEKHQERVKPRNQTSMPTYRPGKQKGDVNECHSRPCKNGATCRDQIHSYTCVCIGGFSGQDCETRGESTPDSGNIAEIAGGLAFAVALVAVLVMCHRQKSQQKSKWQQELSDGLDVGKFSHVGQQQGEPPA